MLAHYYYLSMIVAYPQLSQDVIVLEFNDAPSSPVAGLQLMPKVFNEALPAMISQTHTAESQ